MVPRDLHQDRRTRALIGLFLGSAYGFFGGMVNETIMRIVDIFLGDLGLLLALVLLQVLGSLNAFDSLNGRVLLLVFAFVVTFWPFYTRLVRGQVLVARERMVDVPGERRDIGRIAGSTSSRTRSTRSARPALLEHWCQSP